MAIRAVLESVPSTSICAAVGFPFLISAEKPWMIMSAIVASPRSRIPSASLGDSMFFIIVKYPEAAMRRTISRLSYELSPS